MMDEAAARAWVAEAYDVPRETMERLDDFVALLHEENSRQNLVSSGSLEKVWTRHIADSAQLLRFVPTPSAPWVDLGTGAGFPGLVVALLHQGPVTLVEARRLRVDFLRRAADRLGVRVAIVESKAERLAPQPFDVISARAFAPLGRLFQLGTGFSTAKSVWLLPKGRNAAAELEAAASAWQGDFRLEPSVTDPEARILIASNVRRRGKGRLG